MPNRRSLLAWPLAAIVGPVAAQQRRSLADPLRVGVDQALMASGLGHVLQRGFGVDTGVAVQLVAGPALPLLSALERGELDMTLTNTPEAEDRLDQQGLAHDRHAVAAGEFLLVGPRPAPKSPDPAGLLGITSAAEALVRLRDAAPNGVTFLSAGDGSGTHVLEQSLWRAARIAPVAPWYASASRGEALVAEARARGAYALVERGAWEHEGGAPLAALVAGDPALRERVQVLSAFRVSHPAAKLFTSWITGPKGRRVVAAQRAYQVAGA